MTMNEQKQPQPTINNKQIETAITKVLETFAMVRTAFSSERALMAWMRTSVSLFTFGFTITKFFDYLRQKQGGAQFSEGLHRLGLALICLGILVLMLGVIAHILRIKRGKELGLPTISKFSLPIGAAVALLVIGIVTLIGISLNLSL
jgi:putative membrane protein